MPNEILFAFWFFVPAGAANMAPVFGAAIPGFKNWQAPMDFGRSYRGKRLFGPHKTWRGFVSGLVFATFIVWLQQYALRHYGWVQTMAHGVDYRTSSVWLLGLLFTIGALGGDALESFFKRQRGIASGETWLPFDQLDYIVGGLLLTLPVVTLRPLEYILIVIMWFGLHLLATYVGWLLGLKERPL